MLPTPFNDDWYVQTETVGKERPLSGPISLPHDAMIHEDRDPECKSHRNSGFYPGGRYRYSKTVPASIVDNEWQGRSVTLEFEGVYHRSQVLVNGQLAGGRPHGYTQFYVEISQFLLPGQDNVIQVIADTSEEPNSRWYSSSGIYRPVSIYIGTRSLAIPPLGVRLTTKSLQGTSALVSVAAQVEGSTTSSHLVLSTKLIDSAGTVVASATSPLPARDTASATTTVTSEFAIENVSPWSPESPTLYTLQVDILDGSTVVDTATDEVGIRVLALDTTNGFQVNGKTYKFRGTCLHHDNGVIGACTLAVAEERKIRLLKKAGYNAIRSSHHPCSMSMLRACDREGILVMDELTDIWGKSKTTFDYSLDFEKWWRKDLAAMVARDYNRPSVVMYSIGNEIVETAFKRGIAQTKIMADKCKELDPTRFNTVAINGFLNIMSPKDANMDTLPPSEEEAAAAERAQVDEVEAGTPAVSMSKGMVAFMNMMMGYLHLITPFIARMNVVDNSCKDAFAHVDVAGYNYLVPRYEMDVKRYPNRIILGSETGSTHLVEAWPLVEKYPTIIGDFSWTAIDYIGEGSLATALYNTSMKMSYPFPALLAGTPLIDLTGHFQTETYLNMFVWGLLKGPHLAVKPVNHSGDKLCTNLWRATDSMQSWSWKGCEGKWAIAEVYSTGAKVELQLNGKKVASKWAGKGFLTKFDLRYQPGTLVAISYDKDGKEIGRDTLVSANEDTLKLSVVPEQSTIKADGQDAAFIPIELVDDAGILRPLADRDVTLTVEATPGAGQLQGYGSAQPTTEEDFKGTTHSTYYGRAFAVVRSGLVPGEIKVTASADGCEPVTVVITVV